MCPQLKNQFSNVPVIFGLGTTGLFIGDLIHKAHPDAKIWFVGRSPVESEKVQYALQKAGAGYVENPYENERETADAIINQIGGKATMFIGCSGNEVEHRTCTGIRCLKQ